MTLRPTRLDGSLPITADGSPPSQQFLRFYNKAMGAIEAQEAAQDVLLAAITAALANAGIALSTATATARELARINSYTDPTSVLTAADAGTDATVTIAGHDRIYPVQGTIDVPDVTVAGGTITGLAFSTQYAVYYDDANLADTTPTYLAATDLALAQVGTAAGRHFVGVVTTPADGGGGTTGDGGSPPGGGGGHDLP